MATCTVCGSELAVGSMFCGRCGLRTGGGDGPADPAFAPPPSPAPATDQRGGNNLTAIVVLGIALIVAVAAIVWLLLSRPALDEPMAGTDAVAAEEAVTPPAASVAKSAPPQVVVPNPEPVAQPQTAVTAQPTVDGRFYNIYASIDDKSRNSDRQAQRFVDRLSNCGLGGFISHSSQYPGWRPGYVVVISGPYATTRESDGDMAIARGCGLAVYRRAN